MRVVHLSTYDRGGGAARAAVRLHEGLNIAQIDSHVLVRRKTGDEWAIHGNSSKTAKALSLLGPHLDKLPIMLYRRRKENVWSIGWLRNGTVRRAHELKPDLVNLHWVGDGFLAIADLSRFKVPVIWTLHDSWAMTGGCHVPLDCDRYRQSCGACPQLGSKRLQDLSHWLWNKKKRDWQKANLTIVAPSTWLADCVKASPLFERVPVRVIPNGLDLGTFKPIDKMTARDILCLPHGRLIVCAGAVGLLNTSYKGATQLQRALSSLASQGWHVGADLVLFGASQPLEALSNSFATRYGGVISDDVALALFYSAADVFVCPSLSENLPYTVMEAVACGTPVVAFDVGGIPEMVDHQRTGYLARSFDSDDLAKGIAWVLDDAHRRNLLSMAARRKAESVFSIQYVVSKYRELYEEVLAHGRT